MRAIACRCDRPVAATAPAVHRLVMLKGSSPGRANILSRKCSARAGSRRFRGGWTVGTGLRVLLMGTLRQYGAFRQEVPALRPAGFG